MPSVKHESHNDLTLGDSRHDQGATGLQPGPARLPACPGLRAAPSTCLQRRPPGVVAASPGPPSLLCPSRPTLANPLHPAFCESEVGTHVRTAQLPSPFPAPRPTTPARGGSAEPRPGERVTRDRRGRPRARPGSEGATPAGAAAPSNSPTARRFAQGASCCAERLGPEHT